ncbi:beta-1,4-mannosyl-glycoprotein 4-beta-N-acetylglucosaminyltransferase [Eurytemora carolleeae]|uniref:beta-1,4-mannosyl-glycoprotein 4-beta-N-acetylglucosaminyltransferase n=1 Tax=Eurytemora carolleeae TaxID=1294199 RepID=UPI000C777D46|nr:beta-1,4-mannosyl-glycoprotein 4-beta-N-acetylglucosaminyltransferase [Eurytemora carolleeae]|eukprot:XP_023327678.1 beta-1,4-mannosyl-glycoprotein 4-beta-N-acetylglucosaminyltransferase-like [Eurytemora affinis]
MRLSVTFPLVGVVFIIFTSIYSLSNLEVGNFSLPAPALYIPSFYRLSEPELVWKYKTWEKENWRNDSITLPPPEFRNESVFTAGATVCYASGSKYTDSQAKGQCVCRRNYFGESCGIPSSVWFNDVTKRYDIKLRSKPRRIIQALIVNQEFDFFESRVEEHWDSVDVFLIGESSFTARGDEKETLFFQKLKSGWLSKYQHKILYVYLDFFHKKGKGDGWFADSFPRKYLGKHGLPRIHGLEDDDIIVYNDADEIPNRETIEFLKYFQGFPEPINFLYRWTVFGYYWLAINEKGEDQNGRLHCIHISAAADHCNFKVSAAGTWKLVHNIFNDSFWSIRQKLHKKAKYAKSIAEQNITVESWTIGSVGHYAGYHCSWCMPIPGIQNKLISAQSDDGPRWGDYPEKVEPDFIENIRESGTWFDLVSKFRLIEFAPSYVLKNFNKFKDIIVPPSNLNPVPSNLSHPESNL